VLVWSITYLFAIREKFTYSSSDRQLDDIFEGGNMTSHGNVYIRKTKPQKTLEIT